MPAVCVSGVCGLFNKGGHIKEFELIGSGRGGDDLLL